jgi:hypothetical protein
MTGTEMLTQSPFNRLAFVFAIIFCLCIFQLNIGFAQTASTNTEEDKNNQDAAENNTLTNETKDPKIENVVMIKTDNSSSIDIDPQEEKIRRKAMTMIMNISKTSNPLTSTQSASSYFMIELKQKDRNKSKREMQSYHQSNNKKINVNFQRFQKKRYQQVNYTGKHYDYTSYIQNFQANSSR